MKYNPALKPGALWLTVKDALTFNWCLIARKSGEPSKIGKLETATTAGAPIDDAKLWHSIDWKAAKKHVRRLQMRIAKAVKESKHGKVKTLQYLLTNSFYAKLLAVKRRMFRQHFYGMDARKYPDG